MRITEGSVIMKATGATLLFSPPSTWIVIFKHRLLHGLLFGIAKVAQGTSLGPGILSQLELVHVFVNLGKKRQLHE